MLDPGHLPGCCFMCSGLFLYLRPMRRQSRGFSASFSGLSPRVRGHRQEKQKKHLQEGTIPAGAGTPVCVDNPHKSYRDYPRGCGDTGLHS